MPRAPMPLPACLPLAAALASCGAVELGPGWWRDVDPTADLSAAFRDAVPADCVGHRGDVASAEWLPGDRLVFGVEATAGAEIVRRWLVRLEVVGPASAAPPADVQLWQLQRQGDRDVYHMAEYLGARRRLRAVVTGVDGTAASAAETPVVDALMRCGLFSQLDWLGSGRGGPPARSGDGSRERPYAREPDDPVMLAMLFQTMFAQFADNRALRPVLRELADSPGIWRALGYAFGADAHLEPSLGLPRPGTVPAAAPVAADVGQAFCVPVRVDLDGVPVLATVMTVVPARGPLALSAGVVAARGYRPSDPSRAFVLQLLAVQRGDAAP